VCFVHNAIIVPLAFKRSKEHHERVKRSLTITIRVTPDQKEQLDRIARSERRPVSQLAYLLLEEGLERRVKALTEVKAKAAKRTETAKPLK
jgi:predicted transcriptional regulator